MICKLSQVVLCFSLHFKSSLLLSVQTSQGMIVGLGSAKLPPEIGLPSRPCHSSCHWNPLNRRDKNDMHETSWKTILPFFFGQNAFFLFFCRLRVFAKYGIFPTYGYVFFSTTCWKNTGLLRVSSSTRIKYEPKYAYGHFLGTLRGLPIIDQKKCQYGFSGSSNMYGNSVSDFQSGNLTIP